MAQPLVLAIEPDLRQAAIVKRIVREKVLADVAVVDSRDAALEAMRTTIPDVLLLSALMSPRDEDELIAHLRTLENADHLQTHTIPQLASALNPIESRGPRGLLAAFRRKKEPEAAPAGCDPDLFADEIRVFLQRAADKKRERLNARPDAPAADTAWRAAYQHKAAAPAGEVEAAAEAEGSSSSSWSSPFEWKPSALPSPMADPESSIGHAESLIGHAESSIEHSESSIEEPESPIASPESLMEGSESLMAHLRPPAGITNLRDLATPVPAEEPVPAVVAVKAPVPTPEPVLAAAPTLDSRIPDSLNPGSLSLDSPSPDSPSLDSLSLDSLSLDLPIPDSALLDARIPTPMNSDSGIQDQRSGARDVRLGGLASWARAEGRERQTAKGSDDLRALLTGLAVPPAVVSVGYGRGCRIRRVRVPAAREPQETEAVGAVIISKRVLAEQRGQREQSPA